MIHASAQKKCKAFKGMVVDAKTGKPLEMVAVCIVELNQWTTTCAKGKFCFPEAKPGDYTLYMSCLGYAEYRRSVKYKMDHTFFQLKMNSVSLSMDEVVVTAKENLGLSSSSKIEKTALEHVQAGSLQDVMQLLPGQVSVNPNMKNASSISIREVDGGANGALGTAIVIDGAPLSNDANLQMTSTAKGGGSGSFSSVAGSGVDLRQIPTDNIESVEVIRGVPSVEYGDLTSGAVVVKTRAGKTPLNVKIKADPRMKQFYVGKGLRLKGKGEALNVDMDYTRAYNDIRTKYKGYNRMTGMVTYSNEFFKGWHPMSFTAKVTGFQSKDTEKSDPDLLRQEDFSSKDEGVRLNVHGRWSFNKPWLTNIKYSFSGDYTHQTSSQKKIISNNGPTAMATSRRSGEFVAEYLPGEYLSEMTIDGKPVNLFGQVTANVAGKYGAVVNKFLMGVEYRYNVNNGKGRIYDIHRPPFPNAENGTRPRAYTDIPALRKYALFAQEKIKLPLGATMLDIQAGVRVNNFQPDGFLHSEVGFYTEPRINVKYQLLKRDKDKLFHNLSVRYSYGINVKSPTLMHLYPDAAYLDKLSFNYYSNNAEDRLVVVSTKVVETDGNHLKASKNIKQELGLDFSVKGINVSLTGYHEKGSGGFEFTNIFARMPYRVYNPLDEGMHPYYDGGEVMVNGSSVGYGLDTAMIQYGIPGNSSRSDRKGVEFSVNFGKMKALRTSFILDGAWMKSSRYSTALKVERPNTLWNGDKYPYVGFYAWSGAREYERLSTNLRVITHIPELRMLLSATMQTVWKNGYQMKWREGKSSPYIIDDQGERVYGSRVYSNFDRKKYLDPVQFMDKNGVMHDFLPEYAQMNEYSDLIDAINERYFLKEDYPVSFQFNVKVSKEISDMVKLSFFANNVINHRPTFLSVKSGTYMTQNQPLYFGAEIQLKL